MSAARPQGPIEPIVAGQPPIDSDLRIGHVSTKARRGHVVHR